MTPQGARGAGTPADGRPDADRASQGNVVRPGATLTALRDRVMVAALALADADSDDDAAYNAAWARHEEAAREYLAAKGQLPAPVEREWVPRVRRVVLAVEMLRRPTRVGELRKVFAGNTNGVTRFLRALEAAGLPLRSEPDPADRRGLRYWLERSGTDRGG